MKKIFYTSILLLLALTTQAQYSFTGKVVDENDEPVVGAIVRIKGTKVGVISDVDGGFEIEYNKPEAKAIISYIGAVPLEVLLKSEAKDELFFISLQNSPIKDLVTSGPYDGKYSIAPVFVSEKYPITESTTSIPEQINLGQDIPILLEQLPSVVSTSDAGAGIGYSGIRVRGSDASRVNVTINGIPLNDSESQGVFWVNMPDFASSTDRVTLVRGVGTSTNGAGAFGASLHLDTEETPKEAFAEYNGSVGSFHTLKNNIKLGTGERNGWSASARLSSLKSDGYIDRASSDLKSYFVQAEKKYGEDYRKGGSVKFITFKGQEETYQAWYGVREDILETNRTFNPYTYENQVDNYGQEHFQLLLDQGFGENLRADLGLHYTIGKGYFEEFKEDDSLSDYGISSPYSESSDLVRRRWLDNDFYGFITSLDWTKDDHYLKFGGGYNRYFGDHFGEVIQGEFVPQEAIGENYYFNDAQKNDGNVYAKYTYDFDNVGNGGMLRPFVDLQFRRVRYDFVGLALDGNNQVVDLPQTQVHDFLNPKLGLSYENAAHAAYFSYAKAQKEPNRSDYVDSPASQLPVPEELNDFELGYSYGESYDRFSASINGYYMDYNNQLAVTGGVNDVGAYTRVNVDESYRAGVELEASYDVGNFGFGANATWSTNKIKSFTENLELYDDNGFAGFEQIQHNNTDLALSPEWIAATQLGYQTSNRLFSAALISKYVGQQFLDNTSTESRAIDAYFVNNLNASLRLGGLVPQLKELNLNLLVNNFFDQEYESNGYTFGYAYNGAATYENYYYPQAGIHFLTGLNVKF